MTGVFPQKLKVGNPAGGELVDVEALVNTGSLDTVLSASLLAGLEVEPVGVAPSRVADGIVNLPYGCALINITTEIRDDTYPCSVSFGPEGEFLLGAHTLQIFKLVGDLNSGRLIPAWPMRLRGPRRLEPGGGTVRRGRLVGYNTGKE